MPGLSGDRSDLAIGDCAFPRHSDRHRDRDFHDNAEKLSHSTQPDQQMDHWRSTGHRDDLPAGFRIAGSAPIAANVGLDRGWIDRHFRPALYLDRHADPAAAGGLKFCSGSLPFDLTVHWPGDIKLTSCKSCRHVAQGESASLTRKRSLVQIQSCLPLTSEKPGYNILKMYPGFLFSRNGQSRKYWLA
ncbi:hypothetical protein DESC_740230 [Desulfosarcina cetonica]|nr:hypothetical protein DESC_740230 [Desulfosarcina cetonica]